jgi:hypothetical protein
MSGVQTLWRHSKSQKPQDLDPGSNDTVCGGAISARHNSIGGQIAAALEVRYSRVGGQTQQNRKSDRIAGKIPDG